MKKSPLSVAKERFESKEKLVSAVQGLATKDLWLDRVNATKGLGKVSNAKLLRLHDLLTDAKTRFGSRDKLVASILEIEKRTKDAGYKGRLDAYPLPRLLDLHKSVSRRAKRAEVAAKDSAKKPAPAKKAAAEKKAAPKKAAAKAKS
jgi:hypothetical protein